MVYVVMGVSGCGKTTVGSLLAGELELPFYDADDFHPAHNVRKMTAGKPLTDADRKPWLNRLSKEIRLWNMEGGAVLACSALKEAYREVLTGNEPDNLCFIYLKGTDIEILDRLQSRRNHYMPTSLLDSQFDALEEPANALEVSISGTPDEIVSEILMKL